MPRLGRRVVYIMAFTNPRVVQRSVCSGLHVSCIVCVGYCFVVCASLIYV